MTQAATGERIGPDTRIVRNDRFVFGVIDGEAVIIDTDGGKYLNLNRSGTRIIEQLAEPVSFDELCRSLRTRYKVTPEECARDVRAFILDLSRRGIVALDPN